MAESRDEADEREAVLLQQEPLCHPNWAADNSADNFLRMWGLEREVVLWCKGAVERSYLEDIYFQKPELLET